MLKQFTVAEPAESATCLSTLYVCWVIRNGTQKSMSYCRGFQMVHDNFKMLHQSWIIAVKKNCVA